VSDTPPPYPPPRNVIYFFHAANPISLAGIANLPYTDVILGFLIPVRHHLGRSQPKNVPAPNFLDLAGKAMTNEIGFDYYLALLKR
jgi:hypothetical protein